jgi:hypothetical protein
VYGEHHEEHERYNKGVGTYAGAAVGVAGDPGAVYGKHHEEHEDGHHHDAPQVHAQPVTPATSLEYISWDQGFGSGCGSALI